MTNNVYGIDLGTCNMKIYCKSTNKILNEKNTIALVNKDEIYAYGDAAYAMYEKAPETINVTFPVTSGVIADFNNLQSMLQLFLETHVKGKLKGAEFIVAVPTSITDVEKKAFFDMFYKSKTLKPKSVLLCEKPIADAVGLGLDVNEPTGIMIVDIGADTTEISVISLGGLVLSDLLHFGGNKIDESIITHVKRNYNLVIGQKTAQSLKERLGSGVPGNTETMVVVGRDVVSGLPIEMEMSGEVVYEAIKDNLNSICNSIKMILEKTPPELAKDIIHSGIYITGGGSQIHDLDKLFEQITGININTCEEPEECVVRGLVKIVSDNKYKHLAFSMKSKILI
ncbi:MAG: rod shape-determining protein [Clostridiales bacterium]|nr:rod shape-determining protein [Clostridiales bacterium]